MRTTNELVHVLTGLLLLAASLECGKSDHVHLKIHVPNVVHRHKHVKTKLVHIFHPKVVHSDHSSLHYLHSRKDPNVVLANAGYPRPLVNMQSNPELRITEDEFNKWRQEQYQKALEERRNYQDEQNRLEPLDDNNDDDEGENDNDRYHEPEGNDDEAYEKHRASSSSERKELTKHENHNYSPDYEATNSDKTYANYPSRKTNRKKPFRSVQQQAMLRNRNKTRKNKPMQYGFIKQNEAQASNIHPQYYEIEPADDPSFYSTIPKDQSVAASDHQDEIYSGLLSARYNKKIADKSKLLADINYNRKKQAKADTLQRRSQ